SPRARGRARGLRDAAAHRSLRGRASSGARGLASSLGRRGRRRGLPGGAPSAARLLVALPSRDAARDARRPGGRRALAEGRRQPALPGEARSAEPHPRHAGRLLRLASSVLAETLGTRAPFSLRRPLPMASLIADDAHALASPPFYGRRRTHRFERGGSNGWGE